jgi:hypothetical protein
MVGKWHHPSVAVHNAIEGGKTDAKTVSDDAKIEVHKDVADIKIAAHKAGSELKKK